MDEPGEKHTLSLEEVLAAEHCADQARARVGAPTARPLRDEGRVPVAIRSRGRPGIRPERRAYFTFLDIDRWQRLGFYLALQKVVPDADLKSILQRERVPRELWAGFRHVIGRHRRYLYRPEGLSSEEAMELTTLTFSQTRRGLSREDNSRVIKLRKKLFGRSAASQIDEANDLVNPDAAVYSRTVVPAYLHRLWKALDQSGADRHGTSLQTFRLWRRKLQRAKELPGPTQLSQPAKRHQARI